ncbi:DUF2849 domain-containing protein [Aliiroseovarius sp. PTFE2010]|uniref:DUF2849 domain-containing protein n=1 Tax=Aliiroseovarius sp. PTFE2010 TaxID=3417190 RepID=UPI003CED1D54
MARAFTPKVVTANDLLLGDVIYLDANGDWTRSHAQAALFADQDQAEAKLAQAMADLHVVGAELKDAAPGEDGPEPTHFREEFRATGPSNYFHGKQAEV